MDISRLGDLGRAAGVPGVVIGAVVLVLGTVLGLTELLPGVWRGLLLIFVAFGALGLGVLAVAGWIRGREQIARAEGEEAEARNRDVGKAGGRQEAIATGKGGRAINERG